MITEEHFIILATAIIGAVSGTVVAPSVQSFFNRKKSYAETHSITIGGEISIGKEWENFGLQQKKDKEDLRREFTAQTEANTKKINDMELSFNTQLTTLSAENETLRTRVKKLETILKSNNIQFDEN